MQNWFLKVQFFISAFLFAVQHILITQPQQIGSTCLERANPVKDNGLLFLLLTEGVRFAESLSIYIFPELIQL